MAAAFSSINTREKPPPRYTIMLLTKPLPSASKLKQIWLGSAKFGGFTICFLHSAAAQKGKGRQRRGRTERRREERQGPD